MIFVDTSAIYAWTDAAGARHTVAAAALAELLARAEPLVSHNYVFVEALALVQHRLGNKAAAALDADFRALRVEWVDAALHEEAVDGWKRRASRAISLVDQVSFVLMRRLHVDTAFAFDRDFEDAGFALYPPPPLRPGGGGPP